jgi:hypothetical protein
MIVDKVRNATTTASAVHYEVTMRIWPDDLEAKNSDQELGDLVRRAINGIADYPIEKAKE